MARGEPKNLYEPNAINKPGIQSLPEEVVDYALSFLDTEMLPSVRLTCKTLEAITFNRFAEAHFAHVYCWVAKPKAFRCLEDTLQNSPALKTRIRRVTLTDNPYEDLPESALHIVREKRDKDDQNGRDSMDSIMHEGDDLGTGRVLMQRVLRDLKNLPQNVLVDVNLTHSRPVGRRRHVQERIARSVLFSLAISNTAVESLATDYASLENLDDTLAYGRDDFMASMSTIKSFTFVGGFGPVYAALVDLLRSIRQLRHLTFEIQRPSADEEYFGQLRCPIQARREFWLDINYTNLVSLTLRHFALNTTEQDLRQILGQCRSTLTHLTLSRVAFLAGGDCWKCIGEVLLTMPRLVFVELQMVHVRNGLGRGLRPVEIKSLIDGNPPGVRLEGRDDVVRGLQELSHLGPSFFEQPNQDL